MSEATGDIVFWVVIAARILVPLSIPRFPLPGILAALIIDGVDQTIFQQFPSIALEGYQGYDKAFDIYYLTIAFISTLRNWTNRDAFQISRFLYFWRLVGVALFELTNLRLLLLIFPNAFEYFFIFYEAYRLRWEPQKMSRKVAIGAAIFIWVVIKLPKEYWLHIAQFDTTDLLKTEVFRVPVDTGWGVIFQTSPVLCLALILLPILGLLGLLWLLVRRLPPADHAFSLSADVHDPVFAPDLVQSALESEAREIVDVALVEKVAFSALVSLSFAQVLPDIRANTVELLVGITLLVIVNTIVSHLLARRKFGWVFTMWEFVVLVAVNAGLFLVYSFWRLQTGEPVNLTNVIFFVLLLSLLITLYDRYRQIYLIRFKLKPG
jgi:hypothetical protein